VRSTTLLAATPGILTGLLALAAATFVLRTVAPVTSAGRPLPPRFAGAALRLPTALVASLVASEVAAGPTSQLGARLLGIAAAGVAVALRAPFALVVLVGVVVTAGARAAGLP